MHSVRQGSGKPLLLIHGLGASGQNWQPILPALSAQREVIAVDLPGFGQTPALQGEVSIATLADAVTSFMTEQGLTGVDMVGVSMGGRLVLELARRGVGGTTVALSPGGFWNAGQLRFFNISIQASIKLIRALQPVMPLLTGNPVGRTALLAQLSPKPWALPADLTLHEMRSWAASPSFDAALHSLVHGPVQQGAPAGSLPGRIVIGWARQDRICFPSQSKRATTLFPDAALHWFDNSGHYPHWDQPAQSVDLILRSTA